MHRELDQISSAIEMLESRKRQILDHRSIAAAMEARRCMVPMADEVSGSAVRRIFTEIPRGYQLAGDVGPGDIRKCFLPDTWTKVLNSLQRLLGCDSTDICVMYRTVRQRAGRMESFLTFNHRFNAGMNECMQRLRETGYSPWYNSRLRNWSVEEDERTRAILAGYLSCYFRYLTDVRAGLVYRAVRESPFFRPNFTRNDGIPHHPILNSLCTYVWKMLPESRQEMEEDWLEAYFHVHGRERDVAFAAIPLGLELSAFLHRGKVPGGEAGAKLYAGERFRKVIADLEFEEGC